MKKNCDYKIGDKVDDLEILEIIPPTKGSGKPTQYKVKCSICGRIKTMSGSRLFSKNGTTHKACGQGLKLINKRFYRIWCNMRTRTTNKNHEHYNDYGGRGISSNAFENFIDFYDSLYESYIEACNIFDENNVSLERLNVDEDYTKENCTWIHISDQQGNKRSTVEFSITFPNGKTEIHKNISKFANENGLNINSLTDLINGRLKTYKGFTAQRISKKCND